MTTKGIEAIASDIHIIKKHTCPSLSHQSTLTYEIGRTSNSDLLIRIIKNSGTGKFNSDWISVSTILDLIEKTESPFNSSILTCLYERKSLNSAGFLLSALQKEELVQPTEQGGYRRTDKSIKDFQRKSRSRRTKS